MIRQIQTHRGLLTFDSEKKYTIAKLSNGYWFIVYMGGPSYDIRQCIMGPGYRCLKTLHIFIKKYKLPVEPA